MSASPDTRITAPGKKGAEVIADLEALRDSNRLAIHMWEGAEGEWMAANTADFTVPAAEIPTRLGRDTMPLASVSVLPSKKLGLSMLPYMISIGNIIDMGYLINLDQQQEHGPRILRIRTQNYGSSQLGVKKSLGLTLDRLDSVDDLYQGHTEQSLTALAASPEGKAFSDKQLDTLGAHYGSLRGPLEHGDMQFNCCTDGYCGNHALYDIKDSLAFNETILAASKEHLSAIVLPLVTKEGWTRAYHEPAARYFAALAGLQELDKGNGLPVVFYHVGGKDNGSFSYIGQGREELVQVAREALDRLAGEQGLWAGIHDDYGRGVSRTIKDSARDYLGVDFAQRCRELSYATRDR